MRKELWDVYVKIFLVESLYWAVSLGTVFINDSVLTDSILIDDLTVFITFFQVSFSLGLLASLNYINKLIFRFQDNNYRPLDEQQFETTENNRPITGEGEICDSDDEDELYVRPGFRQLSSCTNICDPKTKLNLESNLDLKQIFLINIPQRISLETCKSLFPLSVLYTGMLLLNNYTLKNVGVAFYFVSRSLTTVFNVTFTYFLIDRNVTTGTIICCCLIISGFLLGVDQESVLGSLSIMGVVSGISSSLFTSLFSIFTKRKLSTVGHNIWILILYNNINAIIITSPLLLIHGDIKTLIDDRIVSPEFWSLLSISGVMAFLISMVTNASIKFTSPLTHNISGTAKSCIQTVLAVCYKHETKSLLWWLSNLIILLASGAYSRLRQLEMERTMVPFAELNEDNHDENALRLDLSQDACDKNYSKEDMIIIKKQNQSVKLKPLGSSPA